MEKIKRIVFIIRDDLQTQVDRNLMTNDILGQFFITK
jgi:hypothetical protein